MIPLSASRIKVAQSCSWLLWSKYHLNIPDPSNDGAKRGSICHLVFEVLGTKKRQQRKIVKKILEAGSIDCHAGIKRLVRKHAIKLGVADEDNMSLINKMILNGLSYDFYGDQSGLGKPTKALSEVPFDMIVDEGGLHYRVRGFIDKLFLYKKHKKAVIRDFKTSKSVFSGKEIDDNLQDYIYSLAVKKMFPEYTERISEFLFLKYDLDHNDPKNSSGVVQMKPISDLDLQGLEIQLTATQNYLDNFNEKTAVSNFAARQKFPAKGFCGPLLCGFAKEPNQLKKDGTPMWYCPSKFKFTYVVIRDKNKSFIQSVYQKDFNESLVPEGGSFEILEYSGCPMFNKKS